MTKKEILEKLCDIVDAAGLGDNEKLNALLGREKKKNNVWIYVLVTILTIAAIAGAIYAVYKYLKPEYLDDLDDDFEDDFEDDFFEDEEVEDEETEEKDEDIFATED